MESGCERAEQAGPRPRPQTDCREIRADASFLSLTGANAWGRWHLLEVLLEEIHSLYGLAQIQVKKQSSPFASHHTHKAGAASWKEVGPF